MIPFLPGQPGAHTRQVLLEAGNTDDEIDALVRKSIVRAPELPTA